MVDSYTIHLTDLTHIWVESLGHTAILCRAEEENTSIDPSDDSQLQILLDKLRLALSSSPNTTLNLQINQNSGRERPTLILNLKIELPGSLAPLEWPIYLAAAPHAVFTSRLTVPLLQTQCALTRELEGLKEALQEKDHVIQKLLDKLEVLGTDLGQVFPQATAKSGRKVDRVRAEEMVRGLAPFDIDAWRKGQDGQRVQDTVQSVQNIFSGDNTLDMWKGVGADNWWENVKGSKIGLSKSKAKTPPKPALKQKESTEDIDDFQVQSTPPHLASRVPQASQSIALDDTTDDEDLDAPSQRSKIPDSFPSLQALASVSSPKQWNRQSPLPNNNDLTDDLDSSPPRPIKKLGKIGEQKEVKSAKVAPSTEDETTYDEETIISHKRGSKKSLTPQSASSPEPTKPKQPLGQIGSQNSPSPEFSSLSDEAPKLKKGKLGQIRGKKKEHTTESSAKAPQPRKGKLSKIGGRKKEASPSTSASEEEAHKRWKGKLGQICQRNKAVNPPLSASDDEAPVAQNTAKRKLNVIGSWQKNLREETITLAPREEELRGRLAKVEKEKTPPPRETSEERAERKRLQLKRELEEKTKAPVKKKRKF